VTATKSLEREPIITAFPCEESTSRGRWRRESESETWRNLGAEIVTHGGGNGGEAFGGIVAALNRVLERGCKRKGQVKSDLWA